MTDKRRETTASGHAKGEYHGRSVLTWEKVREIRQVYADGTLTQRQIAAQYGVSQTTIHRIIRNKNWHEADYSPPKWDE